MKHRKTHKVYAMKELSNLKEIELCRLIHAKINGELDDTNIDGKTNNIIREFKFLYTMKKNNVSHKSIIGYENFEVNLKTQKIII